MATASTLKAIRLTHNYSGVFLAPAILFFAITGGLQMFSLHETTRGSTYVPPALLMHLSQVHKKGMWTVPQRKLGAGKESKGPDAAKVSEGGKGPDAGKGSPALPPAQRPAEGPSPAAGSQLPLKIFFAIVAVGLVLSTLTGLVMAWMYSRNKSVVAGVFVAGVVVPLVLLWLQR